MHRQLLRSTLLRMVPRKKTLARNGSAVPRGDDVSQRVRFLKLAQRFPLIFVLPARPRYASRNRSAAFSRKAHIARHRHRYGFLAAVG